MRSAAQLVDLRALAYYTACQGSPPSPRLRRSMTLPRHIAHVRVPPLKCQGIKVKLVPFITETVAWDGRGRWIEPFLGSGSVLFNARPERAIASDVNPHIIDLYQGIQSGVISAATVATFLCGEGQMLRQRGEQYYYYVRDRFNDTNDPLDFLFLNRSCFNGMVRFNKQGRFNVPFCKKIERFRPAYITKICNQVAWVACQMRNRNWTFQVADWRDTLRHVHSQDFVYLDPPYIGRSTDYYSHWTERDANELASAVKDLAATWAYSMWMKNRYRYNDHLTKHFSSYDVLTTEHFYHVGASESLRNAMTEALVISPGSASSSRPRSADSVAPVLSIELC